MRVRPGVTYDLYVEWGETGQTLGVRTDDNQGNTTIARTTGFVESPSGSGVYYLSAMVAPDEQGNYVNVYDSDGGVYAPDNVATEELVVTSTAPQLEFEGDTYITAEELLWILKIRNPIALEETLAARAVVAATVEINREIDLDDDDTLGVDEAAIAQEVCIERAVEWWSRRAASFGWLGVGADLGGPTRAGQNSWEEHAHKLAPLKRQWGLA